jgi:hypothetical protein
VWPLLLFVGRRELTDWPLNEFFTDNFYTMTTKNSKQRLVALAAKSDAKLHELGVFTRNRPHYDENQRFTGMKQELNPVGAAAGGVGVGLAGGGAYYGHKAIQGKFGSQGLESYKQAGRYAMNEGKARWNSGIDKANFKVTGGVAKSSTAARIGSLLGKLRFR